MDEQFKDLRSASNPKARIKYMEGHFATSNSHINLYLDMSTVKCRHTNAREAAREIAEHFEYNTMVDTIICMEGTQVIGAYVAEMLSGDGVRSVNGGKNISILSPQTNSHGQYVFNSIVERMVKGMQILVIAPSVTTGGNVDKVINAIKYYGGNVVGCAAIFSNLTRTPNGMKISSIFKGEDLAHYQSYSPADCPMCRQNRPLDAIVTGMGYTKLQ